MNTLSYKSTDEQNRAIDAFRMRFERRCYEERISQTRRQVRAIQPADIGQHEVKWADNR